MTSADFVIKKWKAQATSCQDARHYLQKDIIQEDIKTTSGTEDTEKVHLNCSGQSLCDASTMKPVLHFIYLLFCSSLRFIAFVFSHTMPRRFS